MEGLGMIDHSFWHGKRVFVTGHTGFKGSWLTQWLVLLGAKVCGYALAAHTEPALFHLLGLGKEMESVTGDIRVGDDVKAAMKSFRPEIVLHLAAQPIVRLSYREPKLTYETNVMGTLNVYEAVRSTETVKAVVCVTSDKCYENREWVWGYRETDPMGGYDPYSSSKGCVELLSASYRNSFFNPTEYGKSHQVALATARAGNVIGGGDWAPDRLLPDCIRSLTRGEPILIRSPYATRPWQHVLEPLSGYLLLAEKLYSDGPTYGEGWNFGPDDDGVMNVENVVKNVIAVWGTGRVVTAGNGDRHEARLLKLDASKARALLHWRPVFTAQEAVRESVLWYRWQYNGQPVKEYTREEIVRYETRKADQTQAEARDRGRSE